MRFDIAHVTRFEYPGPASESQNELRACPASSDRQVVLHYRVTSDPSSRVESHLDWFGTRVDTFGVRTPHEHLEVRAEATVDVGPASRPPAEVSLDALEDQQFRDVHTQWLAPTPLTSWQGPLGDWAHDVAQGATGLLELVNRVLQAVSDRLAYQAGVTDSATEAGAALEGGVGVCQDFAQVTIAALRSLRVPSRYVSGYFFARDSQGGEVEDEAILAETHAWVEVAVPGFGWWGLDPTNRLEVGERHVKVGHGRDYDDVPPLRGAYVGPASDGARVTVDMRRLAQVRQQSQQQAQA